MRRLMLALVAILALSGCGNPDYDPDLCSIWTDLHSSSPTGDNRVQMDKFCTR